MTAKRLPNGNLVIPVGCVTNGVYGLTGVEIGPSDPRFAEWSRHVRPELERRKPFDDDHAKPPAR